MGVGYSDLQRSPELTRLCSRETTRCESATARVIAWHEACSSEAWRTKSIRWRAPTEEQGRGPAACSKTTDSAPVRSANSVRWAAAATGGFAVGVSSNCQATVACGRQPGGSGSARRHRPTRGAAPPSVVAGEVAAARPPGRARPPRHPSRCRRPGRHQWPAQEPARSLPDRTAGASRSPTGGTGQVPTRGETKIVIRAWSTSAEQRWVSSRERRSH